MTKFISVTPGTTFYIDADDGESYMASGSSWFQAFGESWEPVYYTEGLEKLLDEFYKEEAIKLTSRLI